MASNRKNISSFILGFCIMLFSGVFYAWSMFLDDLPAWSAKATSLNFSLFIITFCLGGLLGARLTAKLGQPKVARIGSILILAGGLVFLLIPRLGMNTALAVLYLSYGVLCGVGIGMIYNANLSSVSSLFPGKSGLISGLLLTGFGLGSLIMGKAVMSLAGAIGFYAAFFCGVVLLVATAFLGAPLLTPAAKPAGGNAAPAPGDSVRELTTGEMIKTPVFWLFFLWVVFMTSGGLMVINRAAKIAQLFGAAAVVGMIVSVFNGVSRTFIGAYCDKFGSASSMLLSNGVAILAGVFMIAASFTNSTALMILGLIAAGISYGCAMSMNAVVIREQFGSRSYPSNLSAATLSGIPASLLGPFVSGALQDASGGSYTTTFAAMIVFSLIAAAMLGGILVIWKKNKKKN